MFEYKLKIKNEEKFVNKSAKFSKNSILKIPKMLKNLKEQQATKI